MIGNHHAEPTIQGVPVTLVRHGEVSLLLEPVDGIVPGANLHSREYAVALRALFRRTDVELADNPFQGARGPRRPAVMPRGERGVRVLQTLSLGSWIPEPEQERDVGALRRSIADVGDAVRRINEMVTHGGSELPGYRLRALSPNWLALPMNGGV